MYVSTTSELMVCSSGASTVQVVTTGVALVGLVAITNLGIIFFCGKLGIPLLEKAITHKQS